MHILPKSNLLLYFLLKFPIKIKKNYFISKSHKKIYNLNNKYYIYLNK